MSRKLEFTLGEFYHLYNRGVDKRTVFENDSDYKRFSLLLYLCNSQAPVRFDTLPNWKSLTSPELIQSVFGQNHSAPLVAIGSYCLMPNHYHLLVKEVVENGISTFMHKLSTSYTMYFNSARKRTGSLFQGRFQAEHANSDRYLKYLFSYIHLNPVKLIEPSWKEKGILDKQKTRKYLSSYPYSSYMDYIGTPREFSKIIERKQFPDYFPTKKTFEQNIEDWLSFDSTVPNDAKGSERLSLTST